MGQNKCLLCPRECGAARETDNSVGYCGVTNGIKIARAALHYWEEPCISGTGGSGAIFFSGCSMKCIYCQNFNIAHSVAGMEISFERLNEIFFELKEKGANNINLVTAGHYLPQVEKAIKRAKCEGFDLPFVYNTSSYEKVESLKRLDGLIDIYLPDYKYSKCAEGVMLASDLSNAPDYPEMAFDSITEMVRQVGENRFLENGIEHFENDVESDIMLKGVIVRHLVLPGYVDNSKNAVKQLYERFGNNIYISILNQYTPLQHIRGELDRLNLREKYESLLRKLTLDEYEEVVDFAISLGVEKGFVQDDETAEESFIPEFNLEGVIGNGNSC